MRPEVLVRFLWDGRRALLAWVVGVAAVSAMYASAYPSVKRQGAGVIDSYPRAFRAALNVQDISSGAGYLQASVFGLIGTVLMIMFATVLGARAIAGEEENGTLEQLLAAPVSRVRLVAERFGGLVAATVVLGAGMLLALVAVGRPAELGVPLANLSAAVLLLVLLGVCFGTLALAVGGLTGRRAAVFAVTAAAAVGTYAADVLSRQVNGLGWLWRVSPFHYATGGEPLRSGARLGDVAVLVAITVVLFAVTAVAFDRRDVAA